MKTAPDEPIPHPISPLAYAAGASFLLLIAGGLALGAIRGLADRWGLLGFGTGLGASFVGVFVIYLAVRSEWTVIDLRHRATARDAGEFFALMLRDRRWMPAGRSVANYAMADERRKRIIIQWADRLGEGSFFPHGITGGSILNVKHLGDEFALVTLRFGMMGVSGLTAVSMLVGAVVYNVQELTLDKLAARRGGRWYLVDGSPGDKVDRMLAAAIEAGA